MHANDLRECVLDLALGILRIFTTRLWRMERRSVGRSFLAALHSHCSTEELPQDSSPVRSSPPYQPRSCSHLIEIWAEGKTTFNSPPTLLIPAGTKPRRHHGLHHRRPFDRRRSSLHQSRGCTCDDSRRSRILHSPPGYRWFRQVKKFGDIIQR